MGAHQRVTACPVQVNGHEVAGLGQLAVVGGLQLVDDLPAEASGGPHDPGAAVDAAQDGSPVGRLAATARVERRPVQDDQRRTVRRGHLQDPGAERPRIRVLVAELLDARRHRSSAPSDRQPTVSVPTMFGWKLQMKV